MTRILIDRRYADLITEKSLTVGLTEAELKLQFCLGKLSPEIIKILECEDLELVVSVKVLDKMIFDHGFSAEKISRLHSIICQPMKIFQSATHPDTSVMVMSPETQRNVPIMLPIWLHKQLGGRPPECVHWVSSGYGKNNVKMIEEWEKSGLLIWGK